MPSDQWLNTITSSIYMYLYKKKKKKVSQHCSPPYLGDYLIIKHMLSLFQNHLFAYYVDPITARCCGQHLRMFHYHTTLHIIITLSVPPLIFATHSYRSIFIFHYFYHYYVLQF